jgi:hypothetical protein
MQAQPKGSHFINGEFVKDEAGRIARRSIYLPANTNGDNY